MGLVKLLFINQLTMQKIKMKKEYIDNKVSFNQESTLAGKSIISNIIKAKQNGFSVVMNYIGVESIEIAKERVAIYVMR